MIWLLLKHSAQTSKPTLSIFRNISIFLVAFYFPSTVSAQLKRYEFTENHMGSPFKIIFYAESDSLAAEASQEVFTRVKALNSIMSDYLDGSEINRLSAKSGSGDEVSISPELFDIIFQSVEISRNTKGYFDISMGPVVQLWRHAMRFRKFPDPSEIKKALRRTGHKKITANVTRQTIKLSKKGMRLDVGAIGKGYAADECIKVLRKMGIQSALADAGGDLALSAPPPGEKGWKIEVSSGNPLDSMRVLELANVGVATSGATYRYLEHRQKKYSHIINPKTGVGITEPVRSTVIAPTGALADALATAFSVAREHERAGILRKYPDIKVWLFEMLKKPAESWSYGF